MGDNLSNIEYALQTIISAAQMFGMNPHIQWIHLEKMAWYLQLVQEGHSCPSIAQLLQFLSSVPYEHSREFFMAVRFLIETTTRQGVSFGQVMESFIRLENIYDDGPPPIPGVSPPVYSLDLCKLVKNVYQFQSLLRPVKLLSVISSSRMMVSPSSRYGFYIRCVMHGSNPSRRLVTVSPGMRSIIFRKILENADKSEQDCYRIKDIFKRSL
jgi:hypothetical protein